MTSIKSVCVYCGASASADDLYQNSASELGSKMAKADLQLIYGGGASGLMGMTANAVLDNGGEVTGVFPEFLSKFETPHKGLTEIHIVESMHLRKQKMAELSDCFVVMPGGFGTLEEFFEILTWRQLQLHDKPVFLVNLNGYWDPMLEMLNRIFEEKFARETHRSCFAIVDTVDDLIDAIKVASKGAATLDKARI